MNKELNKYRREIAKKVSTVRQKRLWTQSEFAKLLGLSQNRYSEIERGQGSFTAEQLLIFLKEFNVSICDIVSSSGTAFQKLRNTLARNGAAHLRENQSALPSEKLEDVVNLVYEAIISDDYEPRHIAGLAAVIVENANFPVLTRLRIRFGEAGLIHRFGWLLENTQVAIARNLTKTLPVEWRRKYLQAELTLKTFLGLPWSKQGASGVTDILDSSISHPKTLEEVRLASSKISKKWGVVTQFKPEEFAEALKEARESTF